MSQLLNDIQFEIKIDNRNLKAFSIVCSCLSKIGKELIIEIEKYEQGDSIVTFRALSDAKSALCVIRFEDTRGAGMAPSRSQSFFEYVNIANSFSCKIPIKVITSILKNIKNIVSLSMRGQIVDSEHEIVFDMVLVNSVIRTYRFNYSDCQIMTAAFTETPSTSMIQCHAKVFSKLMEHIHNAHEMTLNAGPSSLFIRSFHGHSDFVLGQNPMGSAGPADILVKRNMATGVSVNTNEFDIYQYRGRRGNEDTSKSNLRSQLHGVVSTDDITFCIKEFKAILTFCESLDVMSLEFYFTRAGLPIKISCGEKDFSLTLIMSTLHPHAAFEPESQMDDSNRSMNEYDEKSQEGLDDHNLEVFDNEEQKEISSEKPAMQDDYEFQFHNDNARDQRNLHVVQNIVDGIGEPLPLSMQEAVLDLSHLAAAVITSPTARKESTILKESVTNSARKRRIIDSQEDD